MIEKVQKLLFSGTAKDSLSVLVGAGMTALLGVALMAALTRNLNPIDFGLVITALAFAQLITDLSEFGLNSAILAKLPKLDDQGKSNFLRSVLTIRLVATVFFGALIFVLANFIARSVFNNTDMIVYIQISVVGILLASLISLGQTVLQSLGRFPESASLNVLANLLRLVGIMTLVILGLIDGYNSYWVMQVSVIVPVVYIFLQFRKRLFSSKFYSNETKQILKFSLPIGLSFALAAMSTRLDQLLVFSLSGEEEAGIYGLAFRMAGLLIFVSSAIGAAVTPRFASLEKEHFYFYFKKVFWVSILFSIGTLLLIPLAHFFIPLLFGLNYVNSVLPFQILTIGMSLFILQIPFNLAIIYFFQKTHFSMYLSIINLILMWFGLNALIPIYKSTGAAVAVASIYLFQLIVMSAYYLYLSKRATLR